MSSKSKTSRRTVLKLGAGVVLAGSGVMKSRPARASTKLRVLLNFYPEASHGYLYQAVATGLYEKAGLEVEIRPGGPQVNGMQLLGGGEVDIAIGAAITVTGGIERGVPATVIMPTFQSDPQALVTRPDINGIAELKGHKILVTTLGRSSYWLWLKNRFGFTDDQLGPYTGSLQPFIQDPTIALGGVIESEPYNLRRAGVDVKAFLLAQDGYPPYGYPLIAMQSFISRDRDVVQRFVRASLEGWKSYLAEPTPGLDLLKAARPEATDDWNKYSLDLIKSLKLVDGGDAQQQGIGIMTDERWKKLADLLIEVGVIKPTTDWKAAYTTEFVKGLGITL
jgi:NitT/TauT family transport system substrate-binding protein